MFCTVNYIHTPIVVQTRKDLHMYRHTRYDATTQTLYINAQHLYKVLHNLEYSVLVVSS